MTPESAYGKMKAATLVEALVAGVIFMTVFLISMNTVAVLMSFPDARGLIETEHMFGIFLDDFLKEPDPYRSHEYMYDRGVIVISTRPHSEHLRTVRLTAELNGGQRISYTMILPIENSDDCHEAH